MSCIRPLAHRRAGYTMAEILIVLAIAGILLALVAPRFSAYARALTGRGAGNYLASDITYAKMQAVRQGQSVQLRVVTPTVYVIEEPGVDPPLRRVNLAQSYSGMTIGAPGAVVRFDSRGLLAGAQPAQLELRRNDGGLERFTISQLGRISRD